MILLQHGKHFINFVNFILWQFALLSPIAWFFSMKCLILVAIIKELFFFSVPEEWAPKLTFFWNCKFLCIASVKKFLTTSSSSSASVAVSEIPPLCCCWSICLFNRFSYLKWWQFVIIVITHCILLSERRETRKGRWEMSAGTFQLTFSQPFSVG